MVTTREYDKIVQEFEIVVVVREEGAAWANGKHEMGWVFLPGNSGLDGNQKVMARSRQAADQYIPNGIIIEVEQHQDGAEPTLEVLGPSAEGDTYNPDPTVPMPP